MYEKLLSQTFHQTDARTKLRAVPFSAGSRARGILSRVVLAALIFAAAASAVCTTTTNGNWTAAIWTGCAGGGTTAPATTDSPVIANAVVINTSITVVAMSINGTTAALTSDGSAHTVTMTGSCKDLLQVLKGATPYALDTSAGSAGNEIAFVCNNISTSYGCVTKEWASPYVAAGINLVHATVTTTGTPIIGYGQSGGDTLNVVNVKCVGGYHCVYGYAPNNLNITAVTWTGGTGGYGVYLPQPVTGTCTISRVTVYDPTTNVEGVHFTNTMTSSGNKGCTSVTDVAVSSDTAGSYYVNGVRANVQAENSAVTVNRVLCKDYETSPQSQGVLAIEGTSTAAVVINNSAGENCERTAWAYDYTTVENNYCNWLTPTGGSYIQGCIWTYPGNPVTFKNNVIVQAKGLTSNLLYYPINNAGANSVVLMYQNSAIAIGGGSNSTCYGLGEGSVISYGLVSPSVAHDNICDGAYWGYLPKSTSNVFATTGTGGVGVYNNDTVNISGTGCSPNCQYYLAEPATNFDNGTTHHPSSIYGDTAIQALWYPEVQSRTIAKCGDYIGNLTPGTSTAETVFQALGNQWNGTNGNITVANINACLYASATPQNAALANAGAGGTYVGHILPNILAAGAAIQ